MIEVRDLWKQFGPKSVLKGVSLTIPDGQALTILGRSGGGKSVLLKHLIGLTRPDRGQVLVDGQDITVMNHDQLAEVRHKFGMLFQMAALFDSMTVGENVGLGLREHRKLPPAEIDARVSELLGMVGLPGIEHLKPASLSGGMRKRVGLARAIAMNPNYVLYDEPTTGLDPITSLTVDAEIIKLRDLENVTSVLVTHQLRDAFYVATHGATSNGHGPAIVAATPGKVDQADFIMLRDGKVAFEGSADELRASDDPYLRSFLS